MSRLATSLITRPSQEPETAQPDLSSSLLTKLLGLQPHNPALHSTSKPIDAGFIELLCVDPSLDSLKSEYLIILFIN
jgi:hypothetical protein